VPRAGKQSNPITDSGDEPSPGCLGPPGDAAYALFLSRYPKLKPLIEAVGVLPDIEPTAAPIAEAVTRVVVGQMLSRKAAVRILDRVSLAARRLGCGVWQLSPEELRRCGTSARKATAILRFAEAYREAPHHFESWRHLGFPELQSQVRLHWGLGDWTASMLAIFHLGHEDIWPSADGSILRVLGLLSDHLLNGQQLDAELAAPFRSYLALYLWKSLDGGFWDRF